jgi:hypothetical protein
VYALWESLREEWKAGRVLLRDLAEGKSIFYYTIMKLTYHGAIREIRISCLDFLANLNCYAQGLVNYGTDNSLSCLSVEPDQYRSAPEREKCF